MSTIEGVDCSFLQGDPNWEKAKEEGIQFAYIKSSEGSFGDPAHLKLRDGAISAGLIVGAYHVVRPSIAAAPQIEAFLRLSEGLGRHPGQLPPALDWELMGPKEFKSGHLVKLLMECARLTEESFGCKPVVYTYPWFASMAFQAHAKEHPDLDPSSLASCPLWLASYSASPPSTKGLPWERVAIQQYAGNNGRAKGFQTAVDRNRFFGTYEDLLSFCDS